MNREQSKKKESKKIARILAVKKPKHVTLIKAYRPEFQPNR
jgi:hypothetical protein